VRRAEPAEEVHGWISPSCRRWPWHGLSGQTTGEGRRARSATVSV
jgi:hypothetical protein